MGQNIPKCSEIFFSEYVEGSRNNKALEIYNPTDKRVNLSQYRIVRWPNGSTQFSMSLSHKLKGFLSSHKTFVIVLDKQDTSKIGIDTPVVFALRKKANAFIGNADSFNFTMSFNGDDALSLEKYNNQLGKYVAVDIFAKIGDKPNPCWTDKYPYLGNGNWYSMDRTLIRKKWITHGLDSIENGVLMATNFNSYFNPSVEWISYPKDMFDSLGGHHCDCSKTKVGSLNFADMNFYPNPVNDLLKIEHKEKILDFKLFNDLGLQVFIDYKFFNFGLLNQLNADFSCLKPGIYFIQLKLESEMIFNGKILKVSN